jgi:hypothetical protein
MVTAPAWSRRGRLERQERLAILGQVSEEETERQPLLNWVQIAAGALAAISSAVILSTLGVAGTLVGAALGSIVASVGSSMYSRGIDVSRQQVATQAVALRRVTNARSDLEAARSSMDRGEAGAQDRMQHAGEELDEAEQALHDSLDSTPESTSTSNGQPTPDPEQEGREEAKRSRKSLSELPWKHVALVAAGMFVVAVVAITVFELTTGRPVANLTGGTDRDSGTTVPGLNREESTPTPTPTETPTDGTTTAPTEDPTASATPSDTASASPTETPSESPTSSETPSQEATDEATPDATPGTVEDPTNEDALPAPTDPSETAGPAA